MRTWALKATTVFALNVAFAAVIPTLLTTGDTASTQQMAQKQHFEKVVSQFMKNLQALLLNEPVLRSRKTQDSRKRTSPTKARHPKRKINGNGRSIFVQVNHLGSQGQKMTQTDYASSWKVKRETRTLNKPRYPSRLQNNQDLVRNCHTLQSIQSFFNPKRRRAIAETSQSSKSWTTSRG